MNNIESLTLREAEVLECIVKGMNNTEIADELFISRHTAKSHFCSILRKMNVSNKIQAAVEAYKNGLIKI